MLNSNVIGGDLASRVQELEDRLLQQSVEYDKRTRELELTNEALRVSKERAEEGEFIFNQFLANCPIYVFFKDSQLRILRLSSNYEEMLGRSVDSLIGKRMSEVFPSELAQTMAQDDLRILTKGVVVTVQEELNGRTYSTIKFPIKISGKPEYLAGFTIDITDRVFSEKLLMLRREELEQANATKDKLFSIISHDLRSAFNAILGFSTLLRENVSIYESRQIEEMASHIFLSSMSSYNLLNNLLDWAKSQTNHLSISPVYFDITSLLEDLILELTVVANKKNVTLSSTVSCGIMIYADRIMVSTILRNLISNAIKYSYPFNCVIVSVVEYPDSYQFSVSDNGLGVSEDIKKKLFSLNINESQLGTADEKGTGLGLVICKDFVEKHGGTIWVESELGKGSVFKFTLSKTIEPIGGL